MFCCICPPAPGTKGLYEAPSEPVDVKLPKLLRAPGPRASTELGNRATLVGMPLPRSVSGHAGIQGAEVGTSECGLTTGLMS